MSGGEDAAGLIARAEDLKRKDNPAFASLLEEIGDRTNLSPVQESHLRYLRGWQAAYLGEYERSIEELTEVLSKGPDPTLRFRAGVTVVNALAIAGRHPEGYSRLSDVLAAMPSIRDPEAREQALVVAAMHYNQAGQFELGQAYAERLLAEKPTPTAQCRGGQLRAEALYRLGRLKSSSPLFDDAIAECARVGEPIYANLLRLYVAHLLLASGDVQAALDLLLAHTAEVKQTGYVRLISEFDSVLAEVYWQRGNPVLAERHAQRAIAATNAGEFTKPLVDAYRILYQGARARGDYPSALRWHERYMQADKGYLTESGARAIAFHVVQQQVAERKRQIETLSKQNEVLQLEQRVAGSVVQTRGLYILLLLSVLAFIAMWLYNTKRSQVHFMKLARRDGLTGIFNRAHFADAAEAILTYCRKGEREACMVLIDLDNFKLVNDTHGHGAGDTVLKRTVQACQAHLRSIDIIGRLGGEEFGILLPDLTPEQARDLAEQFRLAIAGMSGGAGGVGFPVSASFGVTSSRWSGYNLKQLIIHADKALYAAKGKGRNRVQLFDPASVPPADSTTPVAGSFDRRRY